MESLRSQGNADDNDVKVDVQNPHSKAWKSVNINPKD